MSAQIFMASGCRGNRSLFYINNNDLKIYSTPRKRTNKKY